MAACHFQILALLGAFASVSALGGCAAVKRTQDVLVAPTASVEPRKPAAEPATCEAAPPRHPSTCPARLVDAAMVGDASNDPPTSRFNDEQDVIRVFRETASSTVYVTIRRRTNVLSFDELDVPSGSGTGFVWDQQGHIVTNYHVIDSGEARGVYLVTLYNQKTYEAVFIGGDANKDIAVIKLRKPPPSLTPVRTLPAGHSLEVGQTTIAIGNPFGLDHTLTTGVVSALGRDVPGYGGVTIRDMIQTDASINPGNSGGPLLDSRGYLIGMNTMLLSRSGASAGIGFAVPVMTIRRVVTQIIETGRVASPGIGVVPLPDRIAARIGVEGVVIKFILPDSPAAAAGLRGMYNDETGSLYYGDIIVRVDDTPVRTYDDLYNLLDQRQVGDEITLRIRRKTRLFDLKLRLVDQPT